jgi:hypothetical protein
MSRLLVRASTALLMALLLSTPAFALKPSAAPATMDSVRHAWTLLGWKDYTQARAFFERATESEDPVTVYYGLEGIADADAGLKRDPRAVMRRYLKARDHIAKSSLDEGLYKRIDDRLHLYQKSIIEACAPGKSWQDAEGRQALQSIAEGLGGADTHLRLAAWETLGDRAWAGHHSRNAAEAAAHAWRQALNQDPDKIERVRIERKLGEAEELLPGHKHRQEEAGSLSAIKADPELLALLSRCGKCGGSGNKQRRACADVAASYTEFYAPGAKAPQEAKVRNRVKKLQVQLTESGCY